MRQYYTESEIENLPKNLSFSLSKAENEFFDEEKQKNKTNILRIKYISSQKNGDSWNVYLNDDLLTEIKAYRLNKKEKKFLESPEGISILLTYAKKGVRSVADFKSIIADNLSKGE